MSICPSTHPPLPHLSLIIHPSPHLPIRLSIHPSTQSLLTGPQIILGHVLPGECWGHRRPDRAFALSVLSPIPKKEQGRDKGDRRGPRLSPRPEQRTPRMALSSAGGRPREASRGRGPQSWVLKNLEFRWKKIEKDVSGSRTHLCHLPEGQVKRQGSTSRVTP